MKTFLKTVILALSWSLFFTIPAYCDPVDSDNEEYTGGFLEDISYISSSLYKYFKHPIKHLILFCLAAELTNGVANWTVSGDWTIQKGSFQSCGLELFNMFSPLIVCPLYIKYVIFRDCSFVSVRKALQGTGRRKRRRTA